MDEYKIFIDTQESFDSWSATLLQEIKQKDITAIGLDTEFMRERTYYPKLSLIQISTPQKLFCIDPLALKDFSPLKQILTMADLTKVLHSGSQDIEVLVHHFDILPTPIFDTQIAQSLLKEDEHPLSYQALVEKYQDIHLEKDQTRTRWDKRPLTKKQLAYAFEDVHYLLDCYQLICQKIKDKNLESQLKEALSLYNDPTLFKPQPNKAWKKVKGIKRLSSMALALLKELAATRENLAMTKNSPRRWLIKDKTLTLLATRFIEPTSSLTEDKIFQGMDATIKEALVKTISRFWLSRSLND